MAAERPAFTAAAAAPEHLRSSSAHTSPCLSGDDRLTAAVGHLSPTRGAHLKGWHKMTIETPAARPANACFSSGPCAKRPGWTPDSPQRRRAWPFASREDRQGQTQTRDRPDPRGARRPGRLPHRHHARLRHRRGRDGAVDPARRAWRRCASLGEFRRRLGHRRRQAAQDQGRPHAQGGLRRAAQPRRSQFRQRRRVHLERHDLRRARAQRRLDPRRPQGPDDLRRDLGGLRAGSRLAEARCRHLLLAEGSRRRGGAWRHHPQPPRGRAA